MEININAQNLFEINGITGNIGNLFFGEPDQVEIPFELTLKNIAEKDIGKAEVSLEISSMETEELLAEESFLFSVKNGETYRKNIDLSSIREYGVYLISVKILCEGQEIWDSFKIGRVQILKIQNDILGVNGHIARMFETKEGEEEGCRSLDLIAKAGFRWVADDFVWEWCQTEPDVIRIPEYYEKYVNACHERNLNIQMNLKLTNKLYGKWHCLDPEYLKALGTFYRTLARKFKGRIGSWEAEGEVDYWYAYTYAEYPGKACTPEEYAQVLKVVYEAIKSEDPDTVVVHGSLLRNSYAWYHRLLAAGGGNYSDAIAIHPYTYPNSPYRDVTEWLARCKEIAEAYNAKRTVVRISEMGWSTVVGHRENLGCTEIEQAAYVMQAYLVCKQSKNVEYMSYYDIANDGIDIHEMEHNFGILGGKGPRWRTQYMIKPAYCVIPNIANNLTGIEFIKELFFDMWLVGLKYKTADGRELVAIWAKGAKAGGEKCIEIKTEGICGEIKWFDMFGNEHKVDAGEKSFAMELSVDPKFILADSMSEEWGRQPQLSLHRIAHTAKTTHHKPV